MQTLINANQTYYFNGDKITYSEFLEKLNTTFSSDVLFNLSDKENNVRIIVKA